MPTRHPDRIPPFLLLPTLLCAAPGAALAAPVPAFHVSGAVTRPMDWTEIGRGKAFARDTRVVRYTLKGVTHTAHCVPLLSVVQAAQLAINAHIKNHRLQFVVAVQGSDGYTVDFSLAALLPEIGHRVVWLALDEDGRPLTEDAGPLALVVPDDVKPGRWVHGVRAITLIDGAKTAPTGAS